MKMLVRVEAIDEMSGESRLFAYRVEKVFTIDPLRTPTPVAGDGLYVDGYFLTVTARCITVRSDVAERPEVEDVEVFATIDENTFDDLERTAGWSRE